MLFSSVQDVSEIKYSDSRAMYRDIQREVSNGYLPTENLCQPDGQLVYQSTFIGFPCYYIQMAILESFYGSRFVDYIFSKSSIVQVLG